MHTCARLFSIITIESETCTFPSCSGIFGGVGLVRVGGKQNKKPKTTTKNEEKKYSDMCVRYAGRKVAGHRSQRSRVY